MTPKLQVERSLPFLSFSAIRIGGLNNSVILTSLDYNNYTGKLLSYLEPVFLSLERSRFVKCWHAKTDGWAASTFHSNCDGRGPTVTIIKVKDYIFGGYTDVPWSSKYILATKFFFSVQGLKDLEGQRINVGRIWSSLVPRKKKCLLKPVSWNSWKHYGPKAISSYSSPSNLVSSHDILIVWISKLYITRPWM